MKRFIICMCIFVLCLTGCSKTTENTTTVEASDSTVVTVPELVETSAPETSTTEAFEFDFIVTEWTDSLKNKVKQAEWGDLRPDSCIDALIDIDQSGVSEWLCFYGPENDIMIWDLNKGEPKKLLQYSDDMLKKSTLGNFVKDFDSNTNLSNGFVLAQVEGKTYFCGYFEDGTSKYTWVKSICYTENSDVVILDEAKFGVIDGVLKYYKYSDGWSEVESEEVLYLEDFFN